MSDKVKSEDIMELALQLLKNQEDLKLILGRLVDENGSTKKTIDLHQQLLSELMSRITKTEEGSGKLQGEMRELKTISFDIPVFKNLQKRMDKLENAFISRIVKQAQSGKPLNLTDEELIEFQDFASSKKDKELFSLLSEAFATKNRLAEALEVIDQASSLGKDDVHILCQKGQLLQRMERYKEASAIFGHIKTLSPCQSEKACLSSILGMNAYSLAKEGLYQEALDSIDESIKNDNKNEYAWSVKGRILIEMNRPLEALGPIEKALEIKPKYLTALNDKAIALSILGGDYAKEAISIFDKILAINRSPLILKNKALTFQIMHMEKKAIETFGKAIDLNKENSDIYCSRSLAKLNIGDLDGAAADFKVALENGLSKKCANYHMCYCLILRRQGRYNEALLHSEEGLKKNPTKSILIEVKLGALANLGRLEDGYSVITDKKQ